MDDTELQRILQTMLYSTESNAGMFGQTRGICSIMRVDINQQLESHITYHVSRVVDDTTCVQCPWSFKIVFSAKIIT